MPDLSLSALDLFGDTKWGWIVLTVALLSLAFGFLTKIINSGTTNDLTRDELRLLRAFKEQAEGDPRAYLSVELAAYKAGLQSYDDEVSRLKDLGYLEDSNIESYLRYPPVWITTEGMRRATKRR